jgi:hypothetical protein
MTEAEAWLIERKLDPARMDGYNLRDLKRKDFLNSLLLRDEFLPQFGFAILNAAAIDALRGCGPILEIGAGCGYWSHELRAAGLDVIATDPYPTGKEAHYSCIKDGWRLLWMEVEPLTAADAIAKYPGRALLTVWPDLRDEWTSGALEAYSGQRVMYVGEGDGGCTANDRFHEILAEQFTQVATVHIPQFFGIHDRLQIYERNA